EARLATLPEDDVPHEVVANIKHSTDVGILDQECDTCLPSEDTQAGVDEMEIDVEETCDMDTSDSVLAQVSPLQVSSTVNTDLSNVSASDFMLYGLFTITVFVCMRRFPLWHSGLISDVKQREALRSARIQMRRKNFDADARLLTSITRENLIKAQEEEDANQMLSDPAVRLLRKHVNATAARVKGSDSARHQLRRQIWSTSVEKGPPTMWITINPCDLHDPTAQIFAGERIDMDNFVTTLGPDKVKRAENIAKDPYAAAKFFHFSIKTIMETLFQTRVSEGERMDSGKGVFGKVV
ncbi:hypothetical protein EW146_g8956, partial [Bondarzewia mesenterica]